MKPLITSFSGRLCATALAIACAFPALAQDQSQPAGSVSAVAPVASSTSWTLKDLISRLRAENKTIRSKQTDSRIAATGVDRAMSAFQPTVSVSAVRGISETKNSFEEDLVRKDLGIYRRESNDYNLGLTQLLSSGAKLELKTSLSNYVTNNNLLDPGRPPGVYDAKTQYGFTITQPLMRDAGSEVTMARVNVAKLDTTSAEHTARETETSVVAETAMAYHELTLAQQRVVAAREKIQNAQRLLLEARAMNVAGRLPDADVWEVENALSRYKAGLSEALQGERERSNRLRTTILSVAALDVNNLRTADAMPAVMVLKVSPQDALNVALLRRDDYLMRKVQVEREAVQVSYSENQMKPRVDLVASYAKGALEYTNAITSWPNGASDYPTWSMGLQMSLPLGKNRQAQADIEAAMLRQTDAALALKALEVQIANDIDTSFSMLNSALERWQLWSDVHAREIQQLEAEKLKFAAGRSDVREILLREERVVNSLLSTQEQQLAFARAELMLQAAQGTLLDRFQ